MKRLAFLIVFFFAQQAFAATLPVTIATSARTVPLTLELATTEDKREVGLMHRKTLKPHDGMLFVFPQPGYTPFWMKNTLIPLDIIYISARGNIVHIARNATPLSLSPIPSEGEYLSVIEIDGGRARREGIAEGDHVSYKLSQDVHVQ